MPTHPNKTLEIGLDCVRVVTGYFLFKALTCHHFLLFLFFF